ncbi:hypothetical protein O6H91_06G123000 [Diphasiastrum complanatum]|uniref:Uncharacterized protein n=6 Tax=Diphasiastrum complanatum TaxID=34168 RepID=A0ACC2DI55_DIPCM|nr:hypothetical protein O6H91_06G123000 [Diphasiastrum complanatum]KAJ7554024.1 hypothetical protein O6H91_06G123000 [Diphasiastrum complanatum]KAJ7554025.1 hypothetical protein O6H91_06G123000 [Diphasiastrum complanatum]KAJ7554026.1 hypothetical protein O6H91_06G123000 [Diphasiastrum complanatum]KAJ7554027.1 hypothetical protein O6H91_06G123000 [Diphasiastrum complanatum]
MSRFLLKSPVGSQRAQEGHGTPSEIGNPLHELSGDTRESSRPSAGNEIEMDLNSNFHMKQGIPDATMAVQEHTSGRARPYVNTPYVSLGNAYTVSLPSWGTAESGIVSARENAMLGQADILTGIPSFSHDIGIQMASRNGVRREIANGSANSSSEGHQITNFTPGPILEDLPVEPRESCILSRFEAIRRARDSYNCTGTQPLSISDHLTTTYEPPAIRIEGQGMYSSGDHSLGISVNGAENHGNLSIGSSRGSSKRKICAVGNSSTGSSSKVSAYTCSYSGTSDPVVLGTAGDNRHVSNGPIFSCVNSVLGETSESMVTSTEGSNLHQAEAHSQQGDWFSSDFSNAYFEETSRGLLLRTLASGEGERRLHTENAVNGIFSIAAEQAASNPDPLQVRQRAVHSQPDLRLSRRMQHEPRTNSYPMNADFTTHLPSSAPFSDGHVNISSANFSSRRENSSARQTESHLGSNVYGYRSRQYPVNALRGGQIRYPSSSAYEVIRPEVLNQINSLQNDTFGTLNPTDPLFHAIPATSSSPAPGFSEYSTRLRSRTPSSQNRHPTSLTSVTSFPPSVFSSPTLEPSSTPGHSAVSTASERPPSSSRVLRRLMLSRQSLLDAFGERSLLSAAGSVIGFPLQRLSALRIGEDQHHRIMNEAINEQMLMLEATILFGGIGLQDQHSDWRLDVDNMSYEELLALGEQIGDVCTGLSEEVISQKLKTSDYVHHDTIATSVFQETEVKCCVCQEEYQEGEELGGLECGHNYHAACIKQWLVQKNLCPVCKAAAFS